jgi:peroxiredoxin
MNLLKSFYISIFMMLAMAIAIYAGWRLYHGAFMQTGSLAWIGVLLTTAPILTVISRVMILKDMARTSARFPIVNLLGAIGVGLAAWSWYSSAATVHAPTWLAPVLAFAGWISFLLYAYWFSSFGRVPSKRLQVGSPLPAFKLTDARGNTVMSETFLKQPTILVFYRGSWCPFCIAQIKELVARYKDLSALGVRVALISPQPHSNTIGLAEKFKVTLDFLTDEGNHTARALGIDIANGLPFGMQMLGYDSDTVMPTVIITDWNGKVVWTHQTDNYRVRPEPNTYLEVLRVNRIVP